MYCYVIRKFDKKKNKWIDIVVYTDIDLAFERLAQYTKNNNNCYIIQQSLNIRKEEE